MGNRYTNIALRGRTVEDVARELRIAKRRAFIAPASEDVVFVYDQATERQDIAVLFAIAGDLSAQLRCVSWGVSNYRDERLEYILCDCGVSLDQYDSCPAYADEGRSPSPPSGGDATILTRAFGHPEALQAVEPALRRPWWGENSWVLEVDRHMAITDSLGLPRHLVIGGYLRLLQGLGSLASYQGMIRIGDER